MRARWAWRVAAGCVVAAVLADLVVDRDVTGSFGDLSFSWFWDVAVFAVALPATLAAGLLLRAGRRSVRLAGYAFLALAAATLTLGVLLIGVQVCYDPGDVCEPTWAQHVAHLASPLAVLAAGYVTQRGRVLP